MVITVKKSSGEMAVLLESREVKIFSLDINGIFDVLRGLHKLRLLVSTNPPDVIHSQGFWPDILNGFRWSSGVRLSTVRCNLLQDYSALYGALFGRVFASVHLYALSRLHLCVCVSNSVRSYLNKETRQTRACVIYNAISNLDPSLRIKRPRSGGIERWVTTGRLSSRKQVDKLIEAFLIYSMGDHRFELLVVGDGSFLPVLSDRYKLIPTIKFTGWVDDVFEYLSKAHYFISFSKSEGLPNSVLEALYVGLPAVLSDIEPHREIELCDEERGGKAVWLFDQFDVAACAKVMGRLSKANYQHCSNAAEVLVRKNFACDQMNRSYRELYSEETTSDGS